VRVARESAVVPDAHGPARFSIWLHEGFAYGGIEMVRVNLRLDVCPRDSEFANAATPAKIRKTVTTFMSILSPKSTVLSVRQGKDQGWIEFKF